MSEAIVTQLTNHLQKRFRSKEIVVRQREKVSDSFEVYIASEFAGLIYVDKDEDDEDYLFEMPILQCDLE